MVAKQRVDRAQKRKWRELRGDILVWVTPRSSDVGSLAGEIKSFTAGLCLDEDLNGSATDAPFALVE